MSLRSKLAADYNRKIQELYDARVELAAAQKLLKRINPTAIMELLNNRREILEQDGRNLRCNLDVFKSDEVEIPQMLISIRRMGCYPNNDSTRYTIDTIFLKKDRFTRYAMILLRERIDEILFAAQRECANREVAE